MTKPIAEHVENIREIAGTLRDRNQPAAAAHLERMMGAMEEIEMETREEGQWTLAEVNEAAYAALNPDTTDKENKSS